MEAGIERRAPARARVPLDLWVRLSHEDFEEPFDADGVDLSAGGLALRSDYLPEVGDRLRCRFDCPPDRRETEDGSEMELDGEVVWAHDAGERSGEFGLRFRQLDAASEQHLRRIVERLGGAPDAPPPARLHLDSVPTPIEGELVERTQAWVTVEQPLPFLRLGTGVAMEGAENPPRGRLASVELRLQKGMPRLLLGVELDTEDEVAADAAGAGEIAGAARSPADEVDTLDEVLDEVLGEVEAASAAPDPEDATLQDVQAPTAGPDAAAAASGATEARHEPHDADRHEEQAVRVFRVGADEERGEPGAESGESDESADAARAAPDAPDAQDAATGALAVARARGRALLGAARARSSELATRARPTAAKLWAKLVLAWGVLLERGGPTAKRIGAWLARAAGATGRRFVALVGRGKRAKRRKTTAPPRRVVQSPRLRQQRAEEAAAAAPRRSGRRVAVLSAIAVAGVGATVYALVGGDDPQPAEPAAAASSAAPSAPAAAPAPSPTAAPAEAAAAASAEGSGPPGAETSGETGAAEAAQEASPELQAGRLGEPSYPTLRDATERSRGSRVTEGTLFGAEEVEDGRAATIRMSQPVTTLRGERQDGGFTVTVPGSLALDRAGPIAAANPSIERAMILNRGDHAVLTVRFVAGRTPPYRVRAMGSALEVTVGR